MKQVVLLASVVFGIIGSYVPMLFGDREFLSGWSILGGMIGGLIGVWVGVRIYKLIG